MERLAAAGADVTVKNGGADAVAREACSFFVSLAALFAWALVTFQRRQAPQPSESGVSGDLCADAQVTSAPAVRFRDVAGCDEVVEEVSEFREFLAGWSASRRARSSRGCP